MSKLQAACTDSIKGPKGQAAGNSDQDMTRNQYGKDWSNIVSEDDPEHEVHQRRVIRGGSWKDIAYFIQTSTRTFEYQDTSKSYIGFRCAVDFLGRDKKDFE